MKNYNNVYVHTHVMIFFILFLVLLFTAVLPYGHIAYATDGDFSSGDGSASSPYIISNSTDLCLLSSYVNGGVVRSDGKMYSALYYKLGADINMNEVNFSPIGIKETSPTLTLYVNTSSLFDNNQGSGLQFAWNNFADSFYAYDTDTSSYISYADLYVSNGTLPDFESDNFYCKYTFEKAFYGTFDGDGHKIYNLNTTGSIAGLFGYIANAEIKNLVIENSSAAGTDLAGSIVAEMTSSMVSGCAVLSSSSITTGAGATAGGGVGQTSPEITYNFVFPSVSYEYPNIDSFLEPHIGAKYDQTVSGIVTDNTSIYSESIAGGIIGKHQEGLLSNALSCPATLQGETKGHLVGNLSATANCCVSRYAPLFGVYTATSFTYCYFPSDLTDNLDYQSTVTTENLLKDDLTDLHLSGWTRKANEGNTYYYPTPLVNFNIPLTAYNIYLDNAVDTLADAHSSYCLPSAGLYSGYTFAFYLFNDCKYNPGDTLVPMGDTYIYSYYNLTAPNPTEITAESSYNMAYNGSPQTAVSIGYSHPYSTSISYAWYYSEGVTADCTLIENTQPTLAVTHVSESGFYYCRISVEHTMPSLQLVAPDDESYINPYTDTQLFDISISPISANISINATYNSQNTSEFIGLPIPLNIEYYTENILECDKNDLSYQAISTLDGEESEVFHVGTYHISASISHPDYTISVTDGVFSVTPATITATAIGYDGLYDGTPHSVTVTNITTTNNTPYSIAFSVNSVVCENPLYTSVGSHSVDIEITAPDHDTYSTTADIIISPITVTLTVSPAQSTLEKVYDGSLTFPTDTLGERVSASYSGEFSGISPTVYATNAISSSINSGNITVTVNYGISNSNFTISNPELVLDGVITPATVSVYATGDFYGTYNGKTDFIGLVTSSSYAYTCNSVAKPTVLPASARSNSENVTDATFLYVTFSSLGSNYSYDNGTGTYAFPFTLSPVALTVDPTLFTACDKTYDGSTSVSVNYSDGAFIGIIDDDSPIFTVVAYVPSANAATNAQAVIIENIFDANGNYSVDVSSIDFALSAVISKAIPEITVVTGNNIYDNASALPEISCGEGILDGVIKWEEPEMVGEVIDFEKYAAEEEGYASFTYVFRPTDSNYAEVTASHLLRIIHVTVEYVDVLYFGPNNYLSSTEVILQDLKLTAHYTDGHTKELSFGIGGYSVVYQDESRTTFNAGDTYFMVCYCYEDFTMCKIIPVTVNKRVFSVSTNSASYDYIGRDISFYPIGFDQNYMQISGNVGHNANTYTVTVSLIDKVNTSWADGTDDDIYIEWYIRALAQTYPYLIRSSFIYSGEEVTVVVSCDNRSNDFYSISGPLSATNVGTYTLTATIINANFYWAETNDSQAYTFSWEISPLSVPVPDIYGEPFVYDGVNHTLETDTDDSYTLSGDIAWKNSGAYAAYADLIDKNNYVWDNGTTDTVTLSYAVGKVTVQIPAYTTRFFYTGSTRTIALYTNKNYSVSGTSAAINAGTYTVYLLLPDKANYVWANGSVEDLKIDWVISPISVNLPTSSGTGTYNGDEQTAFINADSTHCIVTGNTAVKVGSYTAQVALKNTNNTYWADGTLTPKAIPWEIKPAEIAIPSAPANSIYNGMAQSAIMTTDKAYYLSGEVQTEPGSYVITVTLYDKDNYVWSNGTTADLRYPWKICNLSFSSNGTTETTTTYAAGAALPTPYLDGFTFEGWYLNQSFLGEKVTSLSSISEDTVLYAKWTKSKTSLPDNSSYGDVSKLSEKAIIGLSIGGGSILLAALIIILGMLFKGKGKKIKKPSGKNPTDSM